MNARLTATLCLVLASACPAMADQPAFLVNDINAQPDPFSHSIPGDFVDMGKDDIVLITSTRLMTSTVWYSDGSQPGTMLLDIRQAPGSISQLERVGDEAFYLVSDDEAGFELRKTMIGQSGTLAVSHLNRNVQLLGAGGRNLYFLASRDEEGLEIWRSDGTPAGTVLIRDLAPTARDALTYEVRESVAELGGLLLFPATDGVNGTELWAAGGTGEEVAMVVDIRPGPLGSNPTTLTQIDGDIYFFADTDSGQGLWRTDGTAEGTVLLDETGVLSGGGDPRRIAHTADRLFFVLFEELWTSGLEPSTPFRVTQGDPRVSEIRGREPAATDDFVIFNASRRFESEGREPWRSDGTPEGTGVLKDINPGPISSHPEAFTEVAGEVFFLALEEMQGRELWITDGTEEGTNLVKDIRPGPADSNPLRLTGTDSRLFFLADDGVHGAELWISDGTEAGTQIVEDLNAFPASSFPGPFERLGETAVFAAADGLHGREIWRSDGTNSGTLMIKDIRPGPEGSMPRILASLPGQILFCADDGTHGEELWRTDGTPEGTFLIRDIMPGASEAEILNGHRVGNLMFFRANDGVHGNEIWRTDGTAEGTWLVEDVIPGSNVSGPFQIDAVGDTLYFRIREGADDTLWQTNGTTEGTLPVFDALGLDPTGRSIPRILGQFGSATYVSSGNPSGRAELYASIDGETTLLEDFARITAAAPLGDVVVLLASSRSNASELWVTEGTADTTRQLKEIHNASAPAVGTGTFAPVNGYLTFAADDGTTGTELWATDGTVEGTYLLRDINPGSDGSFPGAYAITDRFLFFTARDSVHGRELWVTDGTPEGTEFLRDIVPGSRGSVPSDLKQLEDYVLFSVRGERFDDGEADRIEIWRSDGTTAGTVLVASLSYVGIAVTFQQEPYFPALQFTPAGDAVLMTPGHAASGMEPWALSKSAVIRTCLGDCNADRSVAVDELITSVSIALGSVRLSQCPAADANQDRRTTVDEIVGGVEHALRGCD